MVDLKKWELQPEQLTASSVMAHVAFESTADLEPGKQIIGQERAIKALEMGLRMNRPGYNIYVSGMAGTGRTSYVLSLLSQQSMGKKTVRDYVYVYNFKNPDEPLALDFDPGEGAGFKKNMAELISRLAVDLPKAFESKEYEKKYDALMEGYKTQSQGFLQKLNQKAESQGFSFQQGTEGLLSIPLKEDGSIIQESEYEALSKEQRLAIEEKSQGLAPPVSRYRKNMKNLETKVHDRLEELEKKTAVKMVEEAMRPLKPRKQQRSHAQYFDLLKEDLVENRGRFLPKKEEEPVNPLALLMGENPQEFFLRYQVNLFIDHSGTVHPPVLEEENPTYYNLTGMIEYKSAQGALTTDFMQLKPGALHKANGGFLVIHAQSLFSNPFAWEALKRSLRARQIVMENGSHPYGGVITSSIKPEPIPLDIKVILIGDGALYDQLYRIDEDFSELFRVVADFDTELKKTEETALRFAQFIANHCKEEGLKHFSKDAVEAVIEYTSKMAEDQGKISAQFNKTVELLYEADAASQGSLLVTREAVEQAIADKAYMLSRVEEKMRGMFREGTYLIHLSGERVGQINGLSVMQVGDYSFGMPSRITASSYQGRYGILNVEREVAHSGSIHDKGVLIISGYIGERYAKEKTPAVTTSITFEQNYSGIDGDSASSTELYVVLSSIAKLPIRQSIAVTGSVSQKGEIQPIGGINQKIEGFFDICQIKGLTGDQGVLMPVHNIGNLMLRKDVIHAVREGQFHIYAISSIEEGLEILTGMSIQEVDQKIDEALEQFSRLEKKETQGEAQRAKARRTESKKETRVP